MILQNAALQQSQALLLNYASTLAREKNVLVQRTLELTERWNQVQVYLRPPLPPPCNCNPVTPANVSIVALHTKALFASMHIFPIDSNSSGLTVTQSCLPCFRQKAVVVIAVCHDSTLIHPNCLLYYCVYIFVLLGRQLQKILSCEGASSQTHLQSTQSLLLVAPTITIRCRQHRKLCHPTSIAVIASLHMHNDIVCGDLALQE